MYVFASFCDMISWMTFGWFSILPDPGPQPCLGRAGIPYQKGVKEINDQPDVAIGVLSYHTGSIPGFFLDHDNHEALNERQ